MTPSKENEMRERSKESKEKESNSLALSARTREELQQIARSIPSVEQVISFAHSIIGFTDDDFIREWHRQMSMSSSGTASASNCLPNAGQFSTPWRSIGARRTRPVSLMFHVRRSISQKKFSKCTSPNVSGPGSVILHFENFTLLAFSLRRESGGARLR